MCRKLVVINELYLGNRQLGFETFSLPKGELLEFTSKQLKDIMKQGKDEMYGLALSETNELVADTEHFFCNNWMVKSHINSLKPKFESDSMANIFYIVIGTHIQKGGMVYDVVSSRYERAGFSEEKTKMLLEMGIISAGAKLQDGRITVAPLEKQGQGSHGEPDVKEKNVKETGKRGKGADTKEPAKEGKEPCAKETAAPKAGKEPCAKETAASKEEKKPEAETPKGRKTAGTGN